MTACIRTATLFITFDNNSGGYVLEFSLDVALKLFSVFLLGMSIKTLLQIATYMMNDTVGPTYTFRSHINTGQTSYIDHIAISHELVGNVTYCEVFEDSPDLSSDHLVILSKLDLYNIVPIVRAKPPSEQFAWNKLSDDEITSFYTTRLERNIEPLLTQGRHLLKTNDIRNEQIDSFSESLVDTIIKSSCDVPIKKFRKHQKSFWNPNLSHLVKTKNVAWRTWVSEGRPRQSDNEVLLCYKAANKAFKKAYSQAQRDFEQKELDKLQDDAIDQRLYWHLVSRSRGTKSQRINSIRDEDGVILSDPSEIRNAWMKHFSKLATPGKSPHFNEQFHDYIQRRVTSLRTESMPNKDGILDTPITEDETNDALRLLTQIVRADAIKSQLNT
ncbi:unnamed protein product [Owenia fusiformis]|uniref:Uncharacterized protein n=1 Tax=Owenia fusiformis TaxID=6347 RepID=A0A8S4QE82_OWEFU|nr:unnamed protein product [Owenia fusiformis]